MSRKDHIYKQLENLHGTALNVHELVVSNGRPGTKWIFGNQSLTTREVEVFISGAYTVLDRLGCEQAEKMSRSVA